MKNLVEKRIAEAKALDTGGWLPTAAAAGGPRSVAAADGTKPVPPPQPQIVNPATITTKNLVRADISKLNVGGSGRWSLTKSFKTPLVQALELPTGVKMAFCAIPAGTFAMSNFKEGTHKVTISRPFWITRTCLKAIEYRAVVPSEERDSIMKNYEAKFMNHDVFFPLFIKDAKTYCDELNKRYYSLLPANYEFRLPTEAELEYAIGQGGTKDPPGLFPDRIAIQECRTAGMERLLDLRLLPREVVNDWGLYAGFVYGTHALDKIPSVHITFGGMGGVAVVKSRVVARAMQYSDGEVDPVRSGKSWYHLRIDEKSKSEARKCRRHFIKGDGLAGVARIVIGPKELNKYPK